MIKNVFRYRHVATKDGCPWHSDDEWRFSREKNRRSDQKGNVSLHWLIETYRIEVPDGTTRERTFSEEVRFRVPGIAIGLDAYQLARWARENDDPRIKLLSRKRVEPPPGWEEEARGPETYYIGEEIKP